MDDGALKGYMLSSTHDGEIVLIRGTTLDSEWVKSWIAPPTLHEVLTRVREDVAERGPRHQMVYRCGYSEFGGECGWSTTNYADIDAHEDQTEPGHLVMGKMERVP